MNAIGEGQTEPKIGSRVHVFSADKKRDLGFGRYMGTVSLSEIPELHADSDAPFEKVLSAEEATDDAVEAVISAMAEQMEEEDTEFPKLVLDSGETMYGFE